MPGGKPRQVDWREFELGGHVSKTRVTLGPRSEPQDALINTEPKAREGQYVTKRKMSTEQWAAYCDLCKLQTLLREGGVVKFGRA